MTCGLCGGILGANLVASYTAPPRDERIAKAANVVANVVGSRRNARRCVVVEVAEVDYAGEIKVNRVGAATAIDAEEAAISDMNVITS